MSGDQESTFDGVLFVLDQQDAEHSKLIEKESKKNASKEAVEEVVDYLMGKLRLAFTTQTDVERYCIIDALRHDVLVAVARARRRRNTLQYLRHRQGATPAEMEFAARSCLTDLSKIRERMQEEAENSCDAYVRELLRLLTLIDPSCFESIYTGAPDEAEMITKDAEKFAQQIAKIAGTTAAEKFVLLRYAKKINIGASMHTRVAEALETDKTALSSEEIEELIAKGYSKELLVWLEFVEDDSHPDLPPNLEEVALQGFGFDPDPEVMVDGHRLDQEAEAERRGDDD